MSAANEPRARSGARGPARARVRGSGGRESGEWIGRKLAWILAGGDAAGATTLSEQQLVDLEREAFLSLCGERKTQARIAHTLKTGKTLRN